MATRDVAELSDGVRLEDFISERTTAKYYKYYKSCGTNCDFEVILEPLSANANMTIAIDNPTRLGDTGAFDFSKAVWSKQAHQTTELVITSDELVNSTSNLFVVGIGGKAGSQYFVIAWSFPHQAKTKIGLTDRIGFKKLQIGVSPDFELKPNQIRYLYYENWVNAPIRLDYQQVLGVAKSAAKTVELEVTTLPVGKTLPKTITAFMGLKWHKKSTESFEFAPTDMGFCVECFFIVRLHNLDMSRNASVNILVSQDDEDGSGFTSALIVGRPTQVSLRRGQAAKLGFSLPNAKDASQLSVDVQYFTGSAKIQLDFNDFEVDLLRPSKTHVKIFGVDTTSSVSNVAARLGSEAVSTKDRYTLEVKAESDLHASVLVSID